MRRHQPRGDGSASICCHHRPARARGCSTICWQRVDRADTVRMRPPEASVSRSSALRESAASSCVAGVEAGQHRARTTRGAAGPRRPRVLLQGQQQLVEAGRSSSRLSSRLALLGMPIRSPYALAAAATRPWCCRTCSPPPSKSSSIGPRPKSTMQLISVRLVRPPGMQHRRLERRSINAPAICDSVRRGNCNPKRLTTPPCYREPMLPGLRRRRNRCSGARQGQVEEAVVPSIERHVMYSNIFFGCEPIASPAEDRAAARFLEDLACRADRSRPATSPRPRDRAQPRLPASGRRCRRRRYTPTPSRRSPRSACSSSDSLVHPSRATSLFDNASNDRPRRREPGLAAVAARRSINADAPIIIGADHHVSRRLPKMIHSSARVVLRETWMNDVMERLPVERQLHPQPRGTVTDVTS